MCIDPISAITLGTSLGGAALSAFGSVSAGNQNAAAAEMQAKIAQANAAMAMTEASGKISRISGQVDQAIGHTRASFGAGNIDVSSGSPLLLQAMSAANGNIDRQLTAAGAFNQSAGQNFTAGQALQKAGDDRTAGWLGAGTALLRGLSSIKGFGLGFGGGGAGDPLQLAGAFTPSGVGAAAGPGYTIGFGGVY